MEDVKLRGKAQPSSDLETRHDPSSGPPGDEIELSENPESATQEPPKRRTRSFTELEIVQSILIVIVFIMFLVHLVYRLSDLHRCYYDMWDLNYVIDKHDNHYRPEYDWRG